MLASATIANPGELAASLLGEPATVIEGDAAPRAERTIALWNPPLTDPELGLRASSLGEASRLLAGFTQRGLRTICFAKSRKAVELIHRFTVERVDAATAKRLAPYRAGYTPAQRREIEGRLMAGELLGVTATDALELGIDIGALDCAISVAFPGTVRRCASSGAGRGAAGTASPSSSRARTRSTSSSCAIPRRSSPARSRRRSSTTRTRASWTGTCSRRRSRGRSTRAMRETLGPEALERAAVLPELKPSSAGWIWAGTDYPAARVGLRSGEPESFTVVDRETGSVLGLVERSRAYSTVHEGAVYLHLGEQHLVRELDLEARTALVSTAAVDWYTQAKKETQTAIEEPLRLERRLGLELFFGRVSVTEQVVAYQRKSISGGDTLETVPLDLPETSFETEAVWFSPTAGQLEGLEEMPKLLSSLHAAEHSLIALLPLWAMCDRWDIGGLSTNVHFQTGRPTIFVYDGHAGGVGITERGFERFEGWVEDTARMLAGCPCSRRLPELRPEPEVRQPERVPRQGRGAAAAAPAARRRLMHARHGLVTHS